MNYVSFSLNGAWDMFYQEEAYTSEEAPLLKKLSHEPVPLMEKAVPDTGRI